MEDKSYREDPLFQLHREYLISYFEYFYQRFSGVGSRKANLNYKFKPTETGQKFIREFILKIAKKDIISFGPTFYFNYFCFQWNYWANSEKIKSLAINIGWIIDKHAYNRFKERNPDFDYLSYEFCSNLKIDKEQILKKVSHLDPTRKKLGPSEAEEENRNVYESGDINRFNHCYLTTTLFSRKSPTCRDCSFKSECKELLKEIYPELAKEKLS